MRSYGKYDLDGRLNALFPASVLLSAELKSVDFLSAMLSSGILYLAKPDPENNSNFI